MGNTPGIILVLERGLGRELFQQVEDALQTLLASSMPPSFAAWTCFWLVAPLPRAGQQARLVRMVTPPCMETPEDLTVDEPDEEVTLLLRHWVLNRDPVFGEGCHEFGSYAFRQGF